MIPRRQWVVMAVCTNYVADRQPFVREWSRHFTKRGAEASYARFEATPAAALWSAMIVNTDEMTKFHQWVSDVFTRQPQGGTPS